MFSIYTIYHIEQNTTVVFPDTQISYGPRVVEVGHSTPDKGYSSSKLYRNTYVIHYVLSGKGEYYGQPVNGPCAFIECSHKPHYYKVDADVNAPQWEQYWIMFSGEGIPALLEKCGLPTEPTVFSCPYINQAFQILRKLQQKSTFDNNDDQFYMLSCLMKLFSWHSHSNQVFLKNNNTRITAMQNVCRYIHLHYADIVDERELSEFAGVSTSHMRRLFKEEFGVPPMRYLSEYRLNQAKKMLTDGSGSIQEIAEIVGFSEPAYFCRIFKKNFHLSPLAYRKMHQTTASESKNTKQHKNQFSRRG